MSISAEPSYLKDLNPVQKEAVLHYGKPLLILAGAGSGKTRVITVKIAHLLESLRLDPRDILAVTFTNKAADEMKERAVGLCAAAENVLIRTFHSFGAWLLRRNAAHIGLDSRFTIYDDEDMVSLLKTIYPEKERRELSRYAFQIGRAKDFARGPQSRLADISADPAFPEIYAAYEEKLRSIGNADFGDLILRCIELLRECPEVRQRLHERFRVIMVDEYQDSNVAQHELLRNLASEDAYVCVVGDDDQSIYRFRGAEIKNIQNFPQIFPGAQIIRLEQNYRSTQNILAAASAVMENNSGRLGKKLWTANEKGPLPVLRPCADENEEASFCLSLMRKNPGPSTAILYRTNAQSRIFETLFAREGLPYRIVGTLRFYEREEVKDAIAFLKFIANPRDEVSFRRIINKPARGLGDSGVEKILAFRGGQDELSAENRGDIPAAMEKALSVLPARAGKGLKKFLDLYRGLEETLNEQSLAEFVTRLIKDSGLEEYHKTRDEAAGTQKLQNLEELVNAAGIYNPGSAGLAQFLEGIELDAARVEESKASNDAAAVTLITMHNTKGLEFDRVIITGMEEGLFPKQAPYGASRAEAGDDEEELEEERRLFYVAITRARKQLYFTCCANRRMHGQSKSSPPSRFLAELPGEIRTGAFKAPGAYPPPEVFAFSPGTTVYHEDYGQGIVWKSVIREGGHVVTVRFDSGKTLEFLPKYERRLERIKVDGL
ncbi:MAG: UvrD-helicase domain-containing protein [Spirochaetales bacterium]|jgi:DNA helicase-2/ATP-dependent DNA helicase PcrA|nr:UvrD-helicase domain-containing protein [Spirochaetales bacterium]